MSKLPKFRKGSVGGLDFSQLNAVMGQLSQGSEAIESSGIKREFDPQSKPLKLILVFAEREENPPSGGVAKYTWEEVILRGDYDGRPSSLPADQLVDPRPGVDADYLDLRSQTQVRFGNADGENYAVSIDSTFESGFVLCAVGRRSDGKKSYVLIPASKGTPGGSLFYVEDPDLLGSPGPIVSPTEGSPVGEAGVFFWPGGGGIKSVFHRGYPFRVGFTDEGFPTIETEPSLVCIDFSIANENLPLASETDVDAKIGAMVPLIKAGTILSVDFISAPEGAEIEGLTPTEGRYAVARPYMPHLTVFCEGLEP